MKGQTHNLAITVLARLFNLDEYIGLGPADSTSFAAFLDRHLLGGLNLPAGQVRLLNGLAPDPQAECEKHEEAIAAAGGLDPVILGLGANGHIGFNEPGSPLDSRTRPVRLAEETRQANARHFPALAPVPEQAITMGIGTILEARQILLLASGPAKAEPLVRMLSFPLTPEFPASALRLHPRVQVLIDGEAARLL